MSTAVSSSPSKLVSRKQAAEFLGVAEQTLAVWKSTGRHHLPVVRVGRLVKYRLSDLEAFVERNSIDCGADNA